MVSQLLVLVGRLGRLRVWSVSEPMVYIECRTDPRYCSLLVRLRFWDNLQGSRHSSHLVSSFLCFIIYFIFIIFALDTFLQKKSFLLSEWLFIDETQTPWRSTILLHYKHLCCFLLDCSNNMVIIWQRIYFVLISSDWLFFQWLFCLICRRIWQLTYRAYEVFLRQKREVMTLYNMNQRPTNASLYSKIGKNISKLTLPLNYYLKCAITSMDK